MGNALAVVIPAPNGARRDGRRHDLLPEEVLLSLQLVARGYTVGQIALLRDVPIARVLSELRRASEAFGAPTVAEAAAEARRRGLIM